jgi:hypothetical protein
MTDDNDCPVSKVELIALQKEMREETGKLRDAIDQLKSTKHTPFLGALALFAVIWAGLWNSQRAIENEVDLIHVEIALALADAREIRARGDKALAQHAAEHVMEHARYNRLVHLVLREHGLAVGDVE